MVDGVALLFLDFATWGGEAGNDFSLAGPRVGTVLNGQVTALRWRRPNTVDGAPSRLTLYRANDSVGMTTVFNPADDGTVGWQVTELDPPVDVQSGDILFCGAFFPTGSSVSSHNVPLPTVVPDTVWTNPVRAWAPQHTNGYPSGGGSATDKLYGIDFVYLSSRQDVLATGITLGDVHGELNAWLTPTGDYYTDSALQAIQTAATGASDQATAAASAAAGAQTAAEGNASAITNVSTQLDSVSGNVGTLLGRLSASLATLLNDSSQAIADWLNGAAADPVQWWTGFLSQYKASTGGSGFGAPDPMAGWTLVDETDWSEELAWAVPADRYVLTFTSTPPRTPGTPVAGVSWHPRLAWWCELIGTLATERHYIDFAETLIEASTGRMFGILLNGGTDTAGHIQAWVKD